MARAQVNAAVVVAAIGIAIIFYAIVPPFQSPDEFDHVKRAYGLLSGQILVATPRGGNSGVWVDDGLLSFMQPYESLRSSRVAKVNAKMIQEAEAARWTGTKSFASAPGTGYYLPLAYLPQALGLLAGEGLGWTVANTYRLTRLSVLLTSVALLLVAFAVFPTNFFTVSLLLLPMTLFQMSSASLDGVTTALTVLCAGLFLRGANTQSTFPRWMAVALGGAIVILATCRVHMIGLTLLPLFLYFVRRERIYLLLSLGSLAVAGVWTVVALLTTHDMRTGGVDQPVIPVLSFYLSHPAQFAEIVWATVSTGAIVKLLLWQFIGILGWLDTLLPVWFYAGTVAVLSATLLLSVSRSTLKDDARARGALLGVSIAAVFLIFALLLAAGTRHPAIVVTGIQGRYFLLPLILVSYALQGNASPLQTTKAYIAYPVLVLWGLVTIYVTADTLLQRYYIS